MSLSLSIDKDGGIRDAYIVSASEFPQVCKLNLHGGLVKTVDSRHEGYNVVPEVPKQVCYR